MLRLRVAVGPVYFAAGSLGTSDGAAVLVCASMHMILIYAATALAIAAAPQDSKPATPMTGRADAAAAPFDRLMLQFIEEHGVPGAALAVAHDGRMLLSRGYGYADRDARTPVEPESLFRIASVSKPVTAAAILKLAELHKLQLSDPVFAFLGLESDAPAGDALDPRWKTITIRQLLHHTGGFDRDKSFDPMFRPVEFAREAGLEPPATPAAVIRAMLRRKLDFDPGARYAYSNFGYCLLGRVVERASGMPYEAFVTKQVLAPAGATGMRLGRTLAEHRAKNEVHYYASGGAMSESVFGGAGGRVPAPYGGFCIESMDSHGGWIASAADLVRFASALDGDKIIKPESMQLVAECPDGAAGHEGGGKRRETWYGLGFSIRPVGSAGKYNEWHNGLLSGTSTLLVRRFDGWTWAALFNTDADAQGRQPAGLIDSKLHEALAEMLRGAESKRAR